MKKNLISELKSKISSYKNLNKCYLKLKSLNYYNIIPEDYDSHSLSKGYQDILRYLYPDFEIEEQKYPINICKHFRFEEIRKLLNEDVNEERVSEKNDFKNDVISEINKNFEIEKEKFRLILIDKLFKIIKSKVSQGIFNQDGELIRTTKGFPIACDMVKAYITNAKLKNYKEEWVIMGDTISYIVV